MRTMQGFSASTLYIHYYFSREPFTATSDFSRFFLDIRSRALSMMCNVSAMRRDGCLETEPLLANLGKSANICEELT